MTDDLTRSKGENFTIQELASMASEGVLRVPEFQRSFRWDGADVLALFDSILKGYPVGSVLLWTKEAPKANVTLGAIEIETEARHDALWVVDGQQRITSLVNAVNPESFERDDRFRVVYLMESGRFSRPNEARGKLAIPLPDLFDISRLFSWLQVNPDAVHFASLLQDMTARLRDFRVPASVVRQADETVLRDIFDRINSAGKRLRSAEIFDAIHRASGVDSSDALSIGAISDRVAASTTFGRIDDATAYQAILVRRHPNITRDSHGEFESDRNSASDFPLEDVRDGYREAERALNRTVDFLSSQVGVPHVAFLPYRFLILVLTRFFALFPNPHLRNLELLRRWFWIAAVRAPELGFSGSTTIVRSLAGNIVSGEESESVQRLLREVDSTNELELPGIRSFRTNYAASKIILCALWWKGPREFGTGLPIEASSIAAMLEGRDTPSDVAIELVPKSKLGRPLRSSAANRALSSTGEVLDLYDLLELDGYLQIDELDITETLSSQLITTPMVEMLKDARWDEFIRAREEILTETLKSFLTVQTGLGFEGTAPLSSFDFDDEEYDGSVPDSADVREFQDGNRWDSGDAR
ncbi:DUF262 domain-containing protein [Prescottella equi]|uniref:DUF262 domain-containing protein n=1 Tax=Rhodococcus hoagii TaxID=43767 RepID=UPI0009BFC9D6|nr:DUF262 domain-containing protein [Prescottella equi]WQB73143.1 DUF262 domain-containing protein [Prescottella equi]